MMSDEGTEAGLTPQTEANVVKKASAVNFDKAVLEIRARIALNPKFGDNALPSSSEIEEAFSDSNPVSKGGYLAQKLLPKIAYWNDLSGRAVHGNRAEATGGTRELFEDLKIKPLAVIELNESLQPFLSDLVKNMDPETLEQAAQFLSTGRSGVDFLGYVINRRGEHGKVVFHKADGSVGDVGDFDDETIERDFPIEASYDLQENCLNISEITTSEVKAA